MSLHYFFFSFFFNFLYPPIIFFKPFGFLLNLTNIENISSKIIIHWIYLIAKKEFKIEGKYRHRSIFEIYVCLGGNQYKKTCHFESFCSNKNQLVKSPFLVKWRVFVVVF